MDPCVLESVRIFRVLSGPEGAKSLLADVSFSLARGEVLAILGPSGAGKSTLLRMLNRLDEPTSGTVLLHGNDYRQLDPRELRRRVGMVMQRPYLFPGTAAANICFGPAQHGIQLSPTEVSSLLEQVGLGGYSERDVATLSGGEAQRVSIARALANGPEVLLVDEPTSALDEAAKLGVEGLLASIVRERHATCVWVTHDRMQARRVADLVLLIESGTAVALGSPEEMVHA